MQRAEPATALDNKAPLAYRPDIDGLRAVAILSVVVFHGFPDLLHGGFIGVDIFFVISGFLISSIILRGLEKNTFSFGSFYLHRVKRIFPALIVVLTACFVVGWFSLLPDEYKQLGKHMAAGAGFIQNLVLWKEAGYFDVASDMKPLLHLWSLSVEEQFYVFYPLLVWALWRLKLNLRIAIVVLTVASFALNVAMISSDPVATFYLPATRVWELLAGALCALTVSANGPVAGWIAADAKRRHRVSAAGLLMIVIALAVIDRERQFPGWWALLPVSGAALLILAGPQAWGNRHILGHPLMVWVGLISYPLYLWHWPLLSFAHIISATPPSAGVRALAVTAAILLAWLTYRLLERPIRFRSKSWLVPATLVLLLAVDGFAGYKAFTREGMSFRLPSNHQQEPISSSNVDPICEAAGGRGLEFCRQSRAGQPTIFILGDSHAWHLFDGISAAAQSTDDIVSARAMGACMGFSGLTSDSKRTDCAAARDRLAADALADNVRTVVFSARWDRYRETASPEVFEQALRDSLSRLTAKGKRVVFVMDIPILDFHPKYCLDIRLPLRPNVSSIATCGVARPAFEDRTRSYQDIVARVLKDYPQVVVFDAAAELCDDKQCWAMKDGKLLYRDYDHLSQIGSEYMARWLWPVIEGKTPPVVNGGS